VSSLVLKKIFVFISNQETQIDHDKRQILAYKKYRTWCSSRLSGPCYNWSRHNSEV